MTALVFLAWTSPVLPQESIDRSWSGVADGAQGYRLPPGVVPAIRGFDVGYERSDHQVKLLFVGPVTRSAIDAGDLIISLQDHDGNDAISGSVQLTDLRGLGRHLDVTRADCPRDCRLRIPHLISSEAFVLTGFAFRLAARGTDRNMLQVKVRQAAHNGYIDVAFVDRAGTAPYFAQVTYAVIPRSRLGPYLVQVRAPGPARGEAVVPRPPGLALLQSFDLRFLNGDHHLQRIAVDLTEDRILARFRDQNGDDPFEWFVEYSVLR